MLAAKTAFARTLVILLLSLALTAGCGQGPRAGTPIANCPDDQVEFLAVNKSGDIEHTDGQFLKLVKRDDQKLVIVDFWATWCGPCRMLSPNLEKIKKSWGDKIEVVKVDVDKCPTLARFFDVRSIPDVRVYRHGTQVADFMGVMPRAEIEALLKSLQ